MASLKDRFEELIHLTWTEFVELEQSGDATVDDAVLCSLIRVCSDTDDISAIKLAFDRIEGLQETPLEVRVPKFYKRYVNAKEIEPGGKAVEKKEEKRETKYDPASAKLRETLKEMRGMPKDVVKAVFAYKKRVEDGYQPLHDPRVKNVICANLLKNVNKGKVRAVELVFEQLDGKLVKTIKLLGGEDVYIDDYTTLIAPAGSEKDEDGVYYSEDKAMTTIWIRGFAQNNKGIESIVEGLDD